MVFRGELEELASSQPGVDSVVAAARLLTQYAYSDKNAFGVKRPAAALGGVFWSVADPYVRTDSVCHATNAYLNILPHLGEGTLLELPERSLADRLAGEETVLSALEVP